MKNAKSASFNLTIMSRSKIPSHIITAIAAMVRPYIGRELSADDLEAAFAAIRRKTVSMGDLAAERGITRQAMLVRLNKAGVRPVGKGGKSGNEYLYDIAQVIGL